MHIPELLQQCSWIDRTVPAVTHMRGGSQARSSPCTPQPLVAPCHAQPAAQLRSKAVHPQEGSCLASAPEHCLQEGYARWELFRQKGLDLYAAHRNNALKR